MKKVYIEGLALFESHFSGVGQYIFGIVKGLDDILGDNIINGIKTPKVKIIIPIDCKHKFKELGLKHISYKIFPLKHRYMSGLDHRGKLPFIDLWCGPGFYLFTRFAAMPLLFSKYAVIVYDISFELYKQYSEENNAKFLSPRTKTAIKFAKKVITISNNAKEEIVNFYKINPDKVIVSYPAANQRVLYRRSEKEIEMIKLKYNINGKYILALSNLEPRKNLDGLVDAYCQLPREISDNISLLLVGVNGWKTEKLFNKIISKVNEGYNIIRPSSYIDDNDKPAILSGAEMLVYPSHYEGFGMPPLEALACGTPVICSNNSSLPEAVGNYASMVDSSNIKSIKAAIEKCLLDKKIKSSLKKDGPMQAENFSWHRSAQIYYNIISENI